MKFDVIQKDQKAEAARLLGYMPILVRDAEISDWERKFCASMIARQRTGKFSPSEKQIGVMQRMVTAFQDRTMRGDVIEADTPIRARRGANIHESGFEADAYRRMLEATKARQNLASQREEQPK